MGNICDLCFGQDETSFKQHQSESFSESKSSTMKKLRRKSSNLIISSLKSSGFHQKLSEYKPGGISQDNLDDKIQQASWRIQSDSQNAIEMFKEISAFIIKTKDNSFRTMEKLAYVQANLANLWDDNDPSGCQMHEDRALAIYRQFQTEYFEQLIILLNNSALRSEKQKKYKEAIDKYNKIVEIQRKYLSMNDERKILTLNNLACAYYESGNKKEGKRVFDSLIEKISKGLVSNKMTTLIQKNLKYYEDIR